ncbi:MAG: pilus assembly PilX N-terminal domain-containing protein [Massilia sp.]
MRRSAHPSIARSKGVGLVTAIFLLVILSGLAVALLAVSTSNQRASALDVQGARAYQAARAGIEWGMYQNLRTANRRCDAAYTFALPTTSSLNGFIVTVTCARLRDLAPDDPAALDRWVITATACNLQAAGGSCPNPSNNPDYVQRRIEVKL